MFKINEYYSFAAEFKHIDYNNNINVWFIREPKEVSWENQEKTQNVSGERLNERDKGETVSLIFLLLAIFFWFTGFNAVETFFSTYGEKVLNIDKSLSSYLLLTVSALFLVFAIPSGFIAGKFGRKKTILLGLVSMMLIFGSLIFVKQIPAMFLLLGLGGIG